MPPIHLSCVIATTVPEKPLRKSSIQAILSASRWLVGSSSSSKSSFFQGRAMVNGWQDGENKRGTNYYYQIQVYTEESRKKNRTNSLKATPRIPPEVPKNILKIRQNNLPTFHASSMANCCIASKRSTLITVTSKRWTVGRDFVEEDTYKRWRAPNLLFLQHMCLFKRRYYLITVSTNIRISGDLVILSYRRICSSQTGGRCPTGGTGILSIAFYFESTTALLELTRASEQ